MTSTTEPVDEDSMPVDFCTLGMFIIDDIELKPNSPPVRDILGGAGSWAAVGARILSPPPRSHSVGWIVDAGSDFPPELRTRLASWQTNCLIRETPGRKTTRGWNGYGANEARAFKYVTPKLRLDENSLSPRLLAARSFHIICAPARAALLVQGILSRRAADPACKELPRPLIVWEPVPDLCVPEQLGPCREALREVDVVSPNHAELCAFFGREGNTADGAVDRDAVEECSASLLESGFGEGSLGAVVVRAGKEGCYVVHGVRSTGKWLPAYHQDASRVLDPTGGGNAFLGGFAVACVRQRTLEVTTDLGPLEEECLWGSVAASFAIEQIGMPALSGAAEESQERWNGSDAFQRLEELKRRLREAR